MENLLLLLPERPQSVVVRYLLTTLIVGICFLLQVGVEMQSGFFGFFLLLPGIFIASLIFRGLLRGRPRFGRRLAFRGLGGHGPPPVAAPRGPHRPRVPSAGSALRR